MYSLPDVARLLDLPAAQVRSYVRAGFLAPDRGPRGELRFSFRDVVLLRTAKELMAAQIAPARVRRALKKLVAQLPSGRPLTSVTISAEGNRMVVRDGGVKWNPESGQGLFDFDVGELARKVAPLVERSAVERSAREAEERSARKAKDTKEALVEQSAEDWFELGCNLELAAKDDPARREEARDAYRRVVELDPHHADAHVNLGRLLHAAGETRAAEAHYRLALLARPDDETAAFNLGVVLEDLSDLDGAVEAYLRALSIDGGCADAHYNISRLYERLGKTAAAVRHLRAYRKLTQGR